MTDDEHAATARQLRRGGYRVKRFAVLALLAAGLSGCALLPGGGPAPLDTYELTAPRLDATSQRSRRQILIAEPSALKALDGERIVIRSAPGSIEYLSGAQWADRLPRIVQARLAETFQRSGRFSGVGLPGDGLAIDYQVITELRTFGVDVRGGTHAQVELFVRILDDRNGTVRASRLFTASAPVGGTSNNAYVAAIDTAFGTASAEIVAWTDGLI
ncbi:ABC-type transport auxiliary lipoprotein family protein [Oryzicola mucosus]|uniref:Membrane integrity-associated transporter subunit PqiC n=1 Tax=Oryzicola mucosus TaxID=2767425 RepID=A0A8J6PQH2_9HYPH|nr:ABC-type transport auxiliary lipoprotein family protein [Oryzicola mucosus]MBD0416190.1 membrane integrity-associated transporter subunit PqiC [Oryzicola mucosus]